MQWSINVYHFPQQALVFTCQQYKSYENSVEKEKFLEMSNFSFFRSVFYHFGDLSQLFSANSLGLEESKISQFGKV